MPNSHLDPFTYFEKAHLQQVLILISEINNESKTAT